MNNVNYNPDVLNCLANLSNDEVFTATNIAMKMLDLLPKSIWMDKNATFLDPCTKTGVFLREIVKRLNEGLKDVIPNEQERINHILTKQVFGIAITELTGLTSRRSLYCSKTANGKFSICSNFDSTDGNIRFVPYKHTWSFDYCIYCGANKKNYDRPEELESHAYEFIHLSEKKLKEVLNMKFDVIIGNPPYQLNTSEDTKQATPLYDKFVEQAKKLEPRYLCMIIPSRWFAGGMRSLDTFRENMLNDNKIHYMVDYPNAKECFPETSIGGGVCYFLWERDYNGSCEFTSINNEIKTTLTRKLNEFPVFVRYNDAINIIHKVNAKTNKFLTEIVSSLNPYSLSSSVRGASTKNAGDMVVYSSAGKGFISPNLVLSGKEYFNSYHIMMSKVTSEHAGEPSKDGTFKVISKIKLLEPNEVCTFSYFLVGNFDSKPEAENLYKYLCTKFARYLLLQAITSINITKDKFQFVPLMDFSKEWTDKDLYSYFELTDSEIKSIEKMIKEMPGDKNA